MRKTKKTAEPAWERNARIDAWKRQQYGWVVYTTTGSALSPQGYIQQVNECFWIVGPCTDDPCQARMFTHDYAYEVLTALRRVGRTGHIEYVGPKHPDE